MLGLGHLKGGKYIEPLTFKRIVPGCLVVGYVLSLSDMNAVVSIPGGLTGVLPYAEISDTLSKRIKQNEEVLTSH